MISAFEGKPEFGRKVKMSKGKNVEKKEEKCRKYNVERLKCRKVKMSKD
jgi:hypothetical protein